MREGARRACSFSRATSRSTRRGSRRGTRAEVKGPLTLDFAAGAEGRARVLLYGPDGRADASDRSAPAPLVLRLCWCIRVAPLRPRRREMST